MTTQDQLPADPKVRRAFEDACLIITPAQSVEFLWERVFTAQERKQLGGDLEAAYRKYGPHGMWMKLRGVGRIRAILDVTHAIEGLSEIDYRWLLREFGETDEAGTRDCPHWNHVKGALYFRNAVIRRLRITKVPTNLQRIVEAFQAANWCPKISNPLPRGAQQLHETLRSLNLNLKKIRFHSIEGGRSITWTTKTQRARTS